MLRVLCSAPATAAKQAARTTAPSSRVIDVCDFKNMKSAPWTRRLLLHHEIGLNQSSKIVPRHLCHGNPEPPILCCGIEGSELDEHLDQPKMPQSALS